MDEQLSMFSASPAKQANEPEIPLSNVPAEPEYETLDYQLADLMVELNDFIPDTDEEKIALNKTLRHCTLEISKCTREGQIAKHITAEQINAIIQTTVVGEVGDYMPLIV